MQPTLTNSLTALTFLTLGLAVAIMGLYVASADDAPGAAAMGLVLMVAGGVLAVKAWRGRLPVWASRLAIVVGVVAAAFAAVLTHAVAAAAPLFPRPDDVPAVTGHAPAPSDVPAVDRARVVIRAAIAEQDLPGLSVAVGSGGSLAWVEGFGWRDVGTRTPVTPATRFNIGTAADVVLPTAATLGLSQTSAEAARAWSPEAIGEEAEDFPLFALLRHVLWEPVGLMQPDYPLPGDRATFYVPRSDAAPARGRRLMYMRDLACCADGLASYSTPADIVRVGMAANLPSLDGRLAGGRVMSLTSAADGTLVVAVTSNIAHADTATVARHVLAAFTAETR